MAKDNDINVHIKANADQAQRALQDFERDLQGLAKDMQNVAPASDQAQRSIEEFEHDLAGLSDELQKASQRQQAAAAEMDGFRFSADKAGDEVGDLNRLIDQLGREQDDLANKSGQAGVDLESTGRKGKSAFDGAAASLAAYAARSVSVVAAIAAITRALNEQSRAMEENSRIAQENQRSILTLQFMGEFFKERPNLQEEVAALAEYGRRPVAEVADAWLSLRSKNPSMSNEQIDAILKETLETGRTDPSAPLNTLADMFALYMKKTGETDANRVQNVLQQTMIEAGSTTEDVANLMPRFLPIGRAAGLSGPESAGLWAFATTQEASGEIATTGLRSMFLGLEGRETPDAARILKRLGVRQDQTFFEKIEQLKKARAAGKFDLPTAQLIAGRTGAPMLLSTIENNDLLMQSIANVQAADRGDIDITATMIRDLFESDPMAKDEEDSRLLDIRNKNLKVSDSSALRNSNALKEREAMWREMGVPTWIAKSNLFFARLLMGAGVSPEMVFSSPIEHWMLEQHGLPSGVGDYSETLGGVPQSAPESPSPIQLDFNRRQPGDYIQVNNSNIIYNEPNQPSIERTPTKEVQ
ncbi:MAG: phage tail tape measure protein [Planctomycetaceae bacterium]|nr:phage tail tape measure protein [Planctomycetaceae bacterium]